MTTVRVVMSGNLYNSVLCRLCAEPHTSRISLSAVDGSGRTNMALINKYLPLKVEEDGLLPQGLCSSCHLQLHNIVNFFRLLVKGQTLLHKLYEHVANGRTDGYEDTALRLYRDDHELRSRLTAGNVAGASKKKRGRPRKDETLRAAVGPDPRQSTPLPSSAPEQHSESSLPDGKRRRKKPVRFSEDIQGAELEKVLRENGVAEETAPSDEEDYGTIEVIGQVQDSRGAAMGTVVMCTSHSDPDKKKMHFRCDTCQILFSQEFKFVEHVGIHKPVAHDCPRCKQSFPSADELRAHLDSSGHSLADVIAMLDVDERSQGDAENTPNSTSHECSICHKVFKFHCSLKAHLKTVHIGIPDGGFSCEVCTKTFKHPSSVVYHKEAEHHTDRLFACSKCSMTFRHRRLLQKHQRVHSTNLGTNCPECGKYFRTKAYLSSHLHVHSLAKKFECEHCHQLYTHKTALALHLRMHSGEKPFKCYFCSKTFTQKGNLYEHVRIHTGEKPFKCELCDRAFTTSSQRRLHLKRHIGEKPHECELCHKTFLYRESLRTHLKRHTGERPFQCERCDKSFLEFAALKKHVRVHTGEKPFACNLCGKCFADNSNLGKHKKIHKLEEAEDELLIGDILPDGLAMNNLALTDGKQFWAVAKQMNTAGDSSNGRDSENQQVIYITYNDPDDPDAKVGSGGFVQVSEALVVTSEPVAGKDIETPTTQKLGDSAMVPQQQGQVVMDEHGNPLRFTTADGGVYQVTTMDGESLQLIGSDGSSMPVRITTAEGETLTTAGLDISAMVRRLLSVDSVTEDQLVVSSAVEAIELVGSEDVRLLSAASLDFLPLA